MRIAGLVFLLLLVVAVLILANAAAPVPHYDFAKALQGSVTVIRTDGHRFSGTTFTNNHGTYTLEARSGGGRIFFRFHKKEIQSVDLPGTQILNLALRRFTQHDFAGAIAPLQALTRQRDPFLAILSPAQRQPVFALIQAFLKTDRPLEAAAEVRRLLDLNLTADENEQAVALNLLCHARIRLDGNATTLALAWCRKHDPGGRSALGWYLLGLHAWRQHDWDRALWLTLQPVAFNGAPHEKYLADCYALAISSDHNLHNDTAAKTLLAEMRTRGLDWPHFSSVPGPAPVKPVFPPDQTHAPARSEATGAHPKTMPDRHLPLRAAEKLVSTSQNTTP